MKRTSEIMACIVVVAVIGCGEQEQSTARLSLEVTEKGKSMVDVAVHVNMEQELFGAAFDIVYNAKILTYKTSGPGTFKGQSGASPITIAALEDGVEGRLVAGVAVSGGVEDFIQDPIGEMMIISFQRNMDDRAKYKLSLENVTLRRKGNITGSTEIANESERR